jgi:hypothetical protein
MVVVPMAGASSALESSAMGLVGAGTDAGASAADAAVCLRLPPSFPGVFAVDFLAFLAGGARLVSEAETSESSSAVASSDSSEEMSAWGMVYLAWLKSAVSAAFAHSEGPVFFINSNPFEAPHAKRKRTEGRLEILSHQFENLRIETLPVPLGEVVPTGRFVPPISDAAEKEKEINQ